MRILLKLRFKLLYIALAVIVIIGLVFLYRGAHPEARTLNAQTLTQEAYEDVFENIAQEKGALYAFAVLKKISFPSEINTHNIGHVIGEELYKQEGIDGIHICTSEFRYACAHALVIGIFADEGEFALESIKDICESSGESVASSPMCFHGVGHGLLAYLNYDFEHAVSLCESVDSENISKPEEGLRFVNASDECVGGVAMEIVTGTHDPDAWDRAKETYVPDGELFMPCNMPFLSEQSRSMCYFYYSERLLTELGLGQDRNYADVFLDAHNACKMLSNVNEQNACVSGLAKEFVFFAERNDRAGSKHMSNEALHQVHIWCALAGEASEVCVKSAVRSLFWGGEIDSTNAVNFCAGAALHKDICFGTLFAEAAYFLTPKEKQRRVCAKIPKPHQAFCPD